MITFINNLSYLYLMRTAVILAGGLGTRLRPLTLTLPKALIDIDGKNLTEHQILLMKKAGIKTVYLAIGHLWEQIKEFFGEEYQGVRIKYVVEHEPLGTAGWVNLIDRRDFEEDFIVINGDDLANVDYKEMHKLHKDSDAQVTMSLFEVDDPRAYGVAELDGNRIKGFVEKPATVEEAPSRLISIGCYVFSPKIFDIIPKQKKIMFEYDVFPKVAEKGKLFAYMFKGNWCTINNLEQWENTKKNWKL